MVKGSQVGKGTIKLRVPLLLFRNLEVDLENSLFSLFFLQRIEMS